MKCSICGSPVTTISLNCCPKSVWMYRCFNADCKSREFEKSHGAGIIQCLTKEQVIFDEGDNAK
jgi:hypothetical protein